MKKRSTSIRLSEEGKHLARPTGRLELLAQRMGVSQSAVLALLIREKLT